MPDQDIPADPLGVVGVYDTRGRLQTLISINAGYTARMLEPGWLICEENIRLVDGRRLDKDPGPSAETLAELGVIRDPAPEQPDA